jgi:hypothetical protein
MMSQITVGGVAVETRDLQSEEQRMRDFAATQVRAAASKPLTVLNREVPDPLDLLAAALNLTHTDFVASVLLPVYRQENDRLQKERIAARTVMFCSRHKIDCPAELVVAVEKAVPVTKRTGAVFNKLTTAEVAKQTRVLALDFPDVIKSGPVEYRLRNGPVADVLKQLDWIERDTSDFVIRSQVRKIRSEINQKAGVQ